MKYRLELAANTCGQPLLGRLKLGELILQPPKQDETEEQKAEQEPGLFDNQ